MEWQTLYPDMTDVGNLYAWRSIRPIGFPTPSASPISDTDAFRLLDDLIPTELAIITTNAVHGYHDNMLLAAGWKPVQKRLNWSPWEQGSHAVMLWIKTFPGRPPATPVEHPQYFNGMVNSKRSAFCCGLKIVGARRVPRPAVTFFLRRYTTPPNARRMARAGYSLVATTSAATYWANGWTPEEHTNAKERAFIGEWRAKARVRLAASQPALQPAFA